MTTVSLIAGVLSAQLVKDVTFQWLGNKLEREGYYERRIEESLESLRGFISEQQVTEDNIELLMVWTQRQKNLYATFYRDVNALLSSYAFLGEEEGAEPQEGYNQITYYDLELADGTPIKAELDCFVDMSYIYGVDLAGFAVGGVVFILMLFVLIHQKIRYINRIEQELKILGSGNLEYPVTIRGMDEITGLAEGIESLKNGILEQQLMKDEAEKANAELVTAMSHDLRTPLTSLIGYLELLTMHRYEDEQQLHSYLEHCREKAFQLKRMSDRLFEYFLVYGKQEQQYQFHAIPCESLVEDICNSQFFDWQEQGGELDCRIGDLTGRVRIDSEYLQRVQDNLLSNLKKYGDTDYPLEIEAFEKEGMLIILGRNHIRRQNSRTESTQIGLRTCRKIIEEHGGAFSWEQEGECFEIEMNLPLYG